MGTPAIVEGNLILGTCMHLTPAKPPVPGSFPFSAPLSKGLVDKVLIGGSRAAVVGSSGATNPVHPGVDLSDPFFDPPGTPLDARKQVAQIATGSSSVFIGGMPAATTASKAAGCTLLPPTVTVGPVGVPTVLIG